MEFAITLPFPPVTSPHHHAVTQAKEQCAHWLNTVARVPAIVIDTLLGYGLGEVAADFCAASPRPDPDLGLLHIFLVWSVLVDDFFDGPAGREPAAAHQAVERLAAVLTIPPAPPDADAPALTAATADLWARLAVAASPMWIEHAAARLRTWLNVFVTEATLRQRGTVPDVATYTAVRRTAIAMDMYADVTERACGFELPEYLRTSDVVKAMHDCMCDIVGFANDVRSLELEEERGEVGNIVLALQARDRRSPQQAVRDVEALVQRACDRFQTLADELPTRACNAADRELARTYTTMVRDQAQTHEAWCQRTIRYRPVSNV